MIALNAEVVRKFVYTDPIVLNAFDLINSIEVDLKLDEYVLHGVPVISFVTLFYVAIAGTEGQFSLLDQDEINIQSQLADNNASLHIFINRGDVCLYGKPYKEALTDVRSMLRETTRLLLAERETRSSGIFLKSFFATDT